jgi:hypothetical protein
MLFFMQRQLLNFFAAVRKEGDPWEWNFLIITKDVDIGTEIWTEKSMLIQKGLPAGRIWLIEAHVTCSFQMKCAMGFFVAHRTVSPRKAAMNTHGAIWTARKTRGRASLPCWKFRPLWTPQPLSGFKSFPIQKSLKNVTKTAYF